MDEEESRKNKVVQIKRWPEGNLPREVLLAKGPEALGEAFLLAVLASIG